MRGDEIQFFPIEDDKSAEVALEAGELDFSRVSIGSVDRYQSQRGHQDGRPAGAALSLDRHETSRTPSSRTSNVRQAIRYGIDVDSIVQAAYMGKAAVEYAMIPPGLVGYWADAPKYKRDVAKAKEYLQKGRPDDARPHLLQPRTRPSTRPGPRLRSRT